MLQLLPYFITPIINSTDSQGFEKVAELNTIFGLLVSIIFILAAVIIFLFKLFNDKTNKINELQIKHIELINKINDNYSENLQNLHNDYDIKLEKIRDKTDLAEDARNKQWSDSEKEMVRLINNVAHVLEINQKLERADSKYLTDKLNQLENNIKLYINSK